LASALGTVLLLLLLLLAFYQRGKRLQAQRLAERQKLADGLTMMEKEMELQKLKLQTEKEAAIVGYGRAIGQNLHDELGSDLAALRYLVADIKKRAKTEDAKKDLEIIENEAQTVYQRSREFMHHLSNVGKQAASYNVFELLDNLMLRFDAGSGLQVNVDADKAIVLQLNPEQNTELYLVVKEAVANCLKHSGATKMDIGIHARDRQVFFEITDNGRGLLPGKTIGRGLGMVTMQQRIKKINGVIQIGHTEKGLQINGSFPVAV
jgi:signal transduction histidine kinase